VGAEHRGERGGRGAPPENQNSAGTNARGNQHRAARIKKPRWLHPLVIAASLIPVGWVAYAFYSDLVHNTRYLTSEPIKEAEHFTGKWALRFLLLSLWITPAIRLTRLGWLITLRRTFGLCAFAYAVVHLGIYFGLDIELMWDNLTEDILERTYITLGMLGLLLMVPLALTSTKGWIRRLGNRRWSALHRLAYVSAVLGCVHFYMAVKRDVTEPLVFAAILAVAFGIRWWRRTAPGRAA
jgi:sulfoxide reductase heme-binding subunit YedZ